MAAVDRTVTIGYFDLRSVAFAQGSNYQGRIISIAYGIPGHIGRYRGTFQFIQRTANQAEHQIECSHFDRMVCESGSISHGSYNGQGSKGSLLLAVGEIQRWFNGA